MNKEAIKKRIMFIQKEDYNYLCYNFLIVLNTLKCFSYDKRFKDFRKLAYVIDFLSSSKDYDSYTLVEMANIYSKAHIKKKLLSHLILVLKKREFIDISINTTHTSLDIWLLKENIDDSFFDKQIFGVEISNTIIINKMFKLRSSKLETFVEKAFASKGVMTWEV